MPFARGALHELGAMFSNGVETFSSTPRDHTRIHISELTACQRKLWLQLRNPRLALEHTSMPQIIGSALHGLTESLITSAHSNIKSEVKVSFEPEYPVIGAADLVDNDTVIDLKFVGDYGYRTFAATGNLAYKIQVLTYAYGLDKPLAAIFMVNRGTLQFKSQLYIVNRHIEEIEQYLTRAKKIYHKEDLPQRDHLDSNNFECRYCLFKEACWRRFDASLLRPIAQDEITTSAEVLS